MKSTQSKSPFLGRAFGLRAIFFVTGLVFGENLAKSMESMVKESKGEDFNRKTSDACFHKQGNKIMIHENAVALPRPGPKGS